MAGPQVDRALDRDIVMKIKRYKQARRVLEFYKRNFKFHEPYQIIGELGPGTKIMFSGVTSQETVKYSLVVLYMRSPLTFGQLMLTALLHKIAPACALPL